METYKSDVAQIAAGIDRVFERLSHPGTFNDALKSQVQEAADKLPQDVLDNLKNVKFEGDSLSIDTPMGAIKLGVVESVPPTRVVYGALRTPVAFNLEIELESTSTETTQAVALIKLDIPKLLVPMVGGKLKEGAKQFGRILSKLPY